MPTLIGLKGQVIECPDMLDAEFIRLSYREAELETLPAQHICTCGRPTDRILSYHSPHCQYRTLAQTQTVDRAAHGL